MVEGSDLPVIEASEILERIEHGEPVIYEHVAIAGDIDLSRLDLPFIHNERSGDMSTLAHVLASRIEIRNSDFLGRINFVNSIFREPLDLSGSTFRQEASFKWATFDGGARFEGASFLRYASFRDAAFLKEAKFQEASFFAIANFGRALFCCPANFVSASFSELCANFLEASFRNDADWNRIQVLWDRQLQFSLIWGIDELLELVFQCRSLIPGGEVRRLCQLSGSPAPRKRRPSSYQLSRGPQYGVRPISGKCDLHWHMHIR
jgi:hypothetical protein